jgi:hypothetical protein
MAQPTDVEFLDNLNELKMQQKEVDFGDWNNPKPLAPAIARLAFPPTWPDEDIKRRSQLSDESWATEVQSVRNKTATDRYKEGTFNVTLWFLPTDAYQAFVASLRGDYYFSTRTLTVDGKSGLFNVPQKVSNQ